MEIWKEIMTTYSMGIKSLSGDVGMIVMMILRMTVVIINVIAISDHHPKMRRELTMSTHVETSGDKIRPV